MTLSIKNGCFAVVLIAGCGGDDGDISRHADIPTLGVVERIEIANGPEGLREIEYRDAKTGGRYRMQASLGEATARSGWIESRSMADESESVRMEWTPTTVRVTSSKADGTSQFWFVGRTGGLDRIDLAALEQRRDASAATDLPFLLRSTTRADALLDTSKLSTEMAVAREMVAQTTSTPTTLASQTFACDNSIDIGDNCAVEAKLTRASKDIFSVPNGWWQDPNTMKLQCGDGDGLVRVQACPVAAYDCRNYRTAKTESTLTVSDPSEDISRANWACTILKSEGESWNSGKKFEVKGVAELKPGRSVKPKDPGDEAKSPSDCKLVWEFPNGTSYVYHSQWEDGHAWESPAAKFEIALSAAAASGSLAVGGKSEIQANVHTCQDDDWGRDDYAISIRGSKSNALYTCSN